MIEQRSVLLGTDQRLGHVHHSLVAELCGRYGFLTSPSRARFREFREEGFVWTYAPERNPVEYRLGGDRFRIRLFERNQPYMLGTPCEIVIRAVTTNHGPATRTTLSGLADAVKLLYADMSTHRTGRPPKEVVY